MSSENQQSNESHDKKSLQNDKKKVDEEALKKASEPKEDSEAISSAGKKREEGKRYQ